MTYSTLVNLLDGWSTCGSGVSTRSSPGHATGHAARCPSGPLVHLCHDGGADTFKLLLLMLKLILLSSLVSIQPSDDFVAFVDNAFLFVFADFVLHLIVLNRRLHVESITLQAVLRLDFVPGSLIFLGVVGCLGDHAVYFLFAQPTLVVGNGNLRILTGSGILGGNIQDAVSVNIKGDLDLWDTAWGRGNSAELGRPCW